MKIHTCALFDLDGVIVDTTNYHFLAWRKIASNFGFELSKENNEKLKGVSRTKCLNIILELSNFDLNENSFNYYLKKKNEIYLDYIKNINSENILPGILKTLNYLKEKNIMIGIGSASKNARFIIEKLKIVPFFDVIVDGNQIVNSKPDPEVFLKGSKALGVLPENCVVFEDSDSGIQAAKAAKMTAIAIGTPDKFSNYDFCFTNFLKIVKSDLDNLFTSKNYI
ncbi:MAG: beta-phosphoglucomutase [Flavobacteriaceae bacterium]|nr:beta-phosphoglucomutase [Flavobacteriaceae bacterium]